MNVVAGTRVGSRRRARWGSTLPVCSPTPAAVPRWRRLVARLRALGYDGSAGSVAATDAANAEPSATTLVSLARGEAVDRSAVIDALGSDAAAVLRRGGALLMVHDQAVLSARIFPMRAVYTLLPFHRAGHDIVYLGADSICLFEIAWAARGYGDRAADLGTGNGFIAAALATRYDHVVAADLSAPLCGDGRARAAAQPPTALPLLRRAHGRRRRAAARLVRPGDRQRALGARDRRAGRRTPSPLRGRRADRLRAASPVHRRRRRPPRPRRPRLHRVLRHLASPTVVVRWPSTCPR